MALIIILEPKARSIMSPRWMMDSEFQVSEDDDYESFEGGCEDDYFFDKYHYNVPYKIVKYDYNNILWEDDDNYATTQIFI